MCVCVYNTVSGDEAETPVELRRMLATANLVPSPHYKSVSDDACLCQIDVRATVESAGWQYSERDGDYMDVQITPPHCHCSALHTVPTCPIHAELYGRAEENSRLWREAEAVA